MGMLKLQDTGSLPDTGMLDRIARRFVLKTLGRFPVGRLSVTEPDGNTVVLGDGEPAANIEILDWRTYRMLFTGGSLGAGESYMEGLWRSDDLPLVVQFFAANIEPMQDLENGAARLARPLIRMLHNMNRNSITGSRRNISAHYDLGNDFFRLFLDETMMYSSAIYASQEMTLDQAAVHKLDVICKKLQLGPENHLLEIGTGWGGLAVHAARNYGCRVTTTTISREQHAFACQRVSEEGLEDRIIVLDQDYRLLEGKYDRIVSVEMIEAVGHQYLNNYFGKLDELLTDDGLILLQAITIPDQRYKYAIKHVDFIKRYIFPGGFLPSLRVMFDKFSRNTRITPVDVHDIGLDYARTLADWRERFSAASQQVTAMGFDTRFQRMWEYYLCYCEGAFRERAISTVQMLGAGHGFRPTGLPGGKIPRIGD
ncbi:cyclopropane-fatty-acyl-phospholipid synthase family protein [Alcanivorax sp. JB21]|nr:cyclopropane-fatty-acyl-phospholipid synthase family protein [Alcanivorax limicola]MBZ2189903.1 cyclopropane-fatty-acyl-phospholipid synthase family protein [Alcanivorax limicola]